MDELKREDMIEDMLGIIRAALTDLDDDTLKEVAKNTINIFCAAYINPGGLGNDGDN